MSIAKQPTIANLIEDMEAIAGALRRQPQRERGHLWRAGETLAELLQRDALPNPALVNMLADGAITRRAYIDVSKAVIRGALPHLSIRFDYHALAARHGSHEAYARGLDKLAELARHRHQSRTAHHEGNLK